MVETLKLMCILAHPDDETLGPGGVLAKYAAEGVETSLLTATRGERGWPGDPKDNPGMVRLGQIREKELRAAASRLGIKQLMLLNYIDGALPEADPAEVISAIAFAVRRIRPQVVITFDPLGLYGHPDHIAIAQFAMAGVVAAASPGFQTEAASAAMFDRSSESAAPGVHTVAKVYAIAEKRPYLEAFETVMGEIRMDFDGEERRAEGWPVWGVSAEIDIRSYWEAVLQAAASHRTQLLEPEKLNEITRRFPADVWAKRGFYRLYSLVNNGRTKETDLFEGLRGQTE